MATAIISLTRVLRGRALRPSGSMVPISPRVFCTFGAKVLRGGMPGRRAPVRRGGRGRLTNSVTLAGVSRQPDSGVRTRRGAFEAIAEAAQTGSGTPGRRSQLRSCATWRSRPRSSNNSPVMSRIALAFSCFFSLLFRGRLPAAAAFHLPAEAALPPLSESRPSLAPVAPPPPPATSVPVPSASHVREEGALVLLGLLQREGRLVDFLRESLDQHADAAIGAAVRDIHRGCKKVLDEHLRLEPVMPGQEDGPVVVPRGFRSGGGAPHRQSLRRTAVPRYSRAPRVAGTGDEVADPHRGF